jgi:DNA-binding response OmpR family regulator
MKKHILSVDDEPIIGELLQAVLSSKGYRVSTAARREQASKIIQDDPPQLIIMDCQIEEGDGFELIEEFKKLVPATPILLLTGFVYDQQVVRDTIEKKADSYLDKTVALSRIVSEIQRLVGDPQDELISA